jgi:phosphatidylserine/phosphatidylglycerophosphate/cardiolipin synthase-like enzyme
VIDTPRNGKKARRVLREGVTCWRIARADRVGILIDGAAYYLALLQALGQARSRIMILGWDFDPGIRLDRAIRRPSCAACCPNWSRGVTI